MTHHHRRFALSHVTLAGRALPGATVDCWEDDAGQDRWLVRIVTRAIELDERGELRGQTKDGRWVTGDVVVADRQAPAGVRRDILVELHGSGTLTTDIELPPPR